MEPLILKNLNLEQSDAILQLFLEGKIILLHCVIHMYGSSFGERLSRFGFVCFYCRNVIHGSDGAETAKEEISLWFNPEELVSYTSNAEKWIYGQN